MAEFLQNVWKVVWQMSLTGGFVCLIVCILRLFLKKAPKSYAYVLWAVVFFRFACPVALSGTFSLIPQWDGVSAAVQGWLQGTEIYEADTSNDSIAPNTGSQNSVMTQIGSENSEVAQDPNAQTGTVQNGTVQNGATQNGIMQSGAMQAGTSQNENMQAGSSGENSQFFAGQSATAQDGTAQSGTAQNGAVQSTGQPAVPSTDPERLTGVGDDLTTQGSQPVAMTFSAPALLWLTGILVIAAVQGTRVQRWKRVLGIAEAKQAGVYELSGIATPFVMGIRHPQIYLPADMDPRQRRYVLMHEQTHIRRKDYLIKWVAFGIACLHWFNPLVWLAYYLMCMDMEMSCDESVLTQMEGRGRKEYAQALLTFAEQSVGGGLAFGEPYAMKRIRNVLDYRRPASVLSVVLTILCLTVSGCLLVDPSGVEGSSQDDTVMGQETGQEDENEDDTDGQQEPTTAIERDEPARRPGRQESSEEESLPALSEELLARLRQYPQADQEELDQFTQFLMDPYHNPFIFQEYAEWSEQNMSQMASTLAQMKGVDISDHEIQQLKDMGMEIYTDLICVSTEDILQAWQAGTGTSLGKGRLPEALKGWYYLEEKDQWYSQAGGVEYADVTCVNVYHYSSLWTLVIYRYNHEGLWGEALLRVDENGEYIFASNVTYDSDGYEELYAPEGFYETAVKRMEESRTTWMNGILAMDKGLWFEAHNGEDLQVLDGVYPSAPQTTGEEVTWYDSPMYCNDIVYYRPEEGETVDQIAAAMMEAMVERMTEPADTRTFTITEYRIVDREVMSMESALRDLWDDYHWRALQGSPEANDWKEFLQGAVTYDGRAPIGEDMWYFIPRGYYAFEGVGLLGATMADEIEMWPEGVVDGMIPFQAQGSEGMFVFILMKDGPVYRLQRADGMRYTMEAMPALSYDEYFAEYGAYMDSFKVGSTSPQITDKSVSWYADLNHDGQDEQILFDWGYMIPPTSAIFAVLDSNGTVLFMDDPAATHPGWRNYYLCEVGGREYLLDYSLYVGRGASDYGFALLELNAENEMAEVDQGAVSSMVGPGEDILELHPDWHMDIPAMVSFAEKANGYLEHSYLLFSTDEDWLGEEIRGSETGMFVTGSPEEPYRQYENYTVFSFEERPTEEIPAGDDLHDILVAYCEAMGLPYTEDGVNVINGPLSEEEWFDAWQQHLDSYEVGSAAPQITDKSIRWYADLNHDGVDEQIVFDWKYMDNATPANFAVLDSEGTVVYSSMPGTPHVGYMSYYLYEEDGEEYLLHYSPWIGQGSGDYRYELWELNAEGEMQIVESDDTYFRVDPIEYVTSAYPDYKMDIGDMTEFAEGVNALLENSYLLFSTDQDWMNGELNQTLNGFVTGSPENPYRQYETYRVLTGKLVVKDADMIGDIHELLKTWCEEAGMPYIE